MSWTLSPEEDVTGYRIHYGPVSRYDEQFQGYPYVVDLRAGAYTVSNQTARYEITGLNKSETLWISIAAYDEEGNQSSFSNEKKLPKENQLPGPILPCQSPPTRIDDTDLRSLLPAWGLLFLLVPAWILALRCRIPGSRESR